MFLGVFLCSISEVTSIFPGQEAKVLEGMSSGEKKGDDNTVVTKVLDAECVTKQLLK